jgi:nucleotide sugar dehydrogenase
MNANPTPAPGLVERISSGAAGVGVIGLGQVGAVTVELIANSGLRVAGCDRSEKRLAEVQARLCNVGCELGSTATHLGAADVIVVSVRAPIGRDGQPNLEPVRAALSAIEDLPRRQRLVILETTIPPGTTRRLAREFSSYPEGAGTLLAYCPERLRVGDGADELRAVPRLVGGASAQATRTACGFLDRLGVTAVAVSQPEVAELAKLLENAFLTTGIALLADITRIAHALGIEAHEVATAASTKPHGYFPFMPGAGVGGHCLLNDLRALRGSARTLGVQDELLAGVEAAAARMGVTAVTRLDSLMRMQDSSLAGALVCIVGVGFKPGCADTAGTPAVEIVRLLRERKARVVYSDSQVPEFAVDGLPVPPVAADAIPRDCAAALILSGDRSVDLAALTARVPTVLDAGGAHVMTAERQSLPCL